jgi:hypothetical protein
VDLAGATGPTVPGVRDVPLERLADVIARWQRARGPLEQMRVVGIGADALRTMSVDDRRVLVETLATRGAPELAAQVHAADLDATSPDQLHRLTHQLLTLEQQQLGAVAASLADPDGRLREPRRAVTSDHTGPDVRVLPPPPPPGPTPPAVDGPLPATDEPAAVTTAEPAELPPAATTAVDHGWGRAATEVALGTLDRPGTPRERFAALTVLEGVPLDGDGLLRVLRAFPDGWQRRAAARRLLTAGGVVDVDAERVVASFAGAGDRTAVAGLLVGGGLAHVGTVTDQLGPRAADRLRRRAARTGAPG